MQNVSFDMKLAHCSEDTAPVFQSLNIQVLMAKNAKRNFKTTILSFDLIESFVATNGCCTKSQDDDFESTGSK